MLEPCPPEPMGLCLFSVFFSSPQNQVEPSRTVNSLGPRFRSSSMWQNPQLFVADFSGEITRFLQPPHVNETVHPLIIDPYYSGQCKDVSIPIFLNIYFRCIQYPSIISINPSPSWSRQLSFFHFSHCQIVLAVVTLVIVAWHLTTLIGSAGIVGMFLGHGYRLKKWPPVMDGEWDSLFVGSIVVVGIMLDVFFFSVLFLIIHSCFFSSSTCSERHWQEEPEKGGIFFRSKVMREAFHVDFLFVTLIFWPFELVAWLVSWVQSSTHSGRKDQRCQEKFANEKKLTLIPNSRG